MEKLIEKKEKNVSALISDARAAMMGVFMIVVMLFHGNFGALGPCSRPFSLYGHWGVDAFLFVSGFGLYYSLAKGKEQGVWQFYWRRFIRILPAAMVAGSILYLCGVAGIQGIFGVNLWYIKTLIIIYLLSPLIYKLLSTTRPTLWLIVMIAVSTAVLIVMIPFLSTASTGYKTAVCWTAARIPVFVLGMYVAGKKFSLQQMLNPVYVVFTALCILAALYFHKQRADLGELSTYLHLLPYVLVAFAMPLMVSVLAWVYSLLKDGVVRRLAVFVGCYSLELYLVHEAIFSKVASMPGSAYGRFLSAYALSFVCALVLKSIADNIAASLNGLVFNKVKS